MPLRQQVEQARPATASRVAAGLPLRAYLRRLIGACLLPLLAVACYQGLRDVSTAQRMEDEAGARTLQQVGDAVDQLLQAHLSTMTVLARSPLLVGDSRLGEFHRLAQAFRLTLGSELIVADDQGRMLLHSARPYLADGSNLPAMPRPAGRSALAQALHAGLPAVGDAVAGPVAQTRIVALAAPVPGGAPSQRALVAVLPLRSLQQLFERVPLQQGWTLSLLDGQGSLLARHPAAGPGAETLQPPSELALQRPTRLGPWTVQLQMSQASRDATLLHAAGTLALGVLGATLLTLLVGTWAGRRLARAVDQLADPDLQTAPAPTAAAIVELAAARHRLDASLAEREQAAQALRASEATLRAMVDGLFDAVVLVDPQRVIRLVNPAFTQLFGYEAAEAIGRTPAFIYLDDADYEAMGRAHFSRHATGAREPYEFEYRRRDGSHVWAESVGLPIRAADGTLLGFVGLHRDITQRRLEREQLRLSQEMFAAAFANNPAAIALTRMDGGAVLDVNAAWLAMTGETRESIIGHSARFLWPDAQQAQRFLQRLHEEGMLRGWEQTFRKRDGEPFHAEIASQKLTMNGEPLVLSTLVDTSARRRAERELRELAATLEQRVEQRTAELALARDQAKEASRAKSAFLANMSHEIRTPMNAIIGLTHLVARDTHEPLQRERLAKVTTAAEHLLQIINDILDLSKIEAGRMQLEQIEFSLHAVMARSFEMVGEAAQRKGLQMQLETAGLPDRVAGDPTRLAQALLNLVGNAVKFTERGWVRLSGRVLERQAASAGSRVKLVFDVQDTGIGIAPDRVGALFAAFEQVDSATNRSHGGTGLGLALTRRLAGLMEGEAGVHSEPGVGSRFWFSAVLREVAGTAPSTLRPRGEAEAALRRVAAGRRVLLAEDGVINQEVAQALLQAVGLAVDIAEDGEVAVRMALDEAPQPPHALILMDVQMPRMDGLQATRELRRRGCTAPIIAVTANAFDEDRRACLQAGMDDHLGKPVDPERLYATLLRWMQPEPADARPAPLPAIAPPGADPLQALRDWPGLAQELDVSDGLRRVGGQPAALLRVLRLFVQQYADGLPALDQPGDAAGITAWRGAAHTLRGSCGTLGAHGLQALAEALQEAVQRGEPLPQLQQRAAELQQRLRALAGLLAQALQATATTAAAP